MTTETKYNFDILMPKEDKELAERRKNELEKTNELLSNVPIQNPEDVIEVAIKTKTKIGQIFINGYNELIEFIGVENLNMKDRKGNLITDLRKVSKGKRKYKSQEIINQYIATINKSDLKRYAIQLSDIFEIPHYIEKDDLRGKSGFYIKYLMPLIIFYLLQKDENVIFTNIVELSCFVGLVNNNYKRISIEKLIKINSKFTDAMLNQFYYRCKPELESIIFRVLDSLQNEYKVLNYYRNYCLFTNDGNCHTSSKNEDLLIRQTERKVLKEFNAKWMLTIFQRKQQKKFYNRVCELINKTYGFDWVRYRKQVQIFADNEALQEIMQDLTNEEIICNKKAVASRFARRIINRTQSEYDRTNKKANNFEIAWVKKQLERPEIAELIQLGFDYEDDFKEMIKELSVFKYHGNYLNVQNELVRLMIGEPETQLEDDIPELKGIM